jgi:hypothetical protein
MRFAIVLFACSLAVPPFAETQTTETSEKISADACATPTEDREELRRDIQAMQTLVDQMNKNLASVATGETPLKHQFRLQIDMWNLILRRMEKRLQLAAPQNRNK